MDPQLRQLGTLVRPQMERNPEKNMLVKDKNEKFKEKRSMKHEENDIPEQSSLYMSIIFSPDLKFCPDLFSDLKSRSYFVPRWGRKVKIQLL